EKQLEENQVEEKQLEENQVEEKQPKEKPVKEKRIKKRAIQKPIEKLKAEVEKKTKFVKQSKAYADKIDRELPYFVTLITLMAASGISPFHSLKKIMNYDVLPTMKKESVQMVKQVEVLGDDPLTVMNQRAEESSSTLFQDFLAGYVSTVQTGGSIINFLKSKMWSMFDVKAAISRQLVTKLAGLVDAYMIIQVVILTLYIMFVALTSTPTLSSSFLPDTSSLSSSIILFLLLPPLMAGMLMFISHKMTTSTYLGTEKILTKSMIMVFGSIIPVIALSAAGFTSELTFLGLPYLLAIALLVGSIKPIMDYKKIQAINTSAERATPSILRDIAEARKTGLSPERCIIHGFKRKGYGIFSTVLNRAVSQLTWGVPLRKIYENIRREVSSWVVQINFKILIEVMESGGGYSDALDTLAKASEMSYNVEKEKQAMLKPYVMIGFMIMGITAFTTLMVIDSFGGMSQLVSIPGTTPPPPAITPEMRNMLAASIVIQAYLVGLFIGKIVSGTFAGGLMYAAMLVATVLMAIAFADYAPIDITSLFTPASK
ncbi:MAG TPA: type II secretion system F family protein, partial [Nitrososphaerales archaeon]|nr:type II secretion system F family protein [Nitrososphaerales archaeon]